MIDHVERDELRCRLEQELGDAGVPEDVAGPGARVVVEENRQSGCDRGAVAADDHVGVRVTLRDRAPGGDYARTHGPERLATGGRPRQVRLGLLEEAVAGGEIREGLVF